MKVEMTAEAADRAKVILNICLKRSERMINGITKSGISMKVTDVSIHTVKEYLEVPPKSFEEICANVGMEFSGDLYGMIGVSFPIESAARLVMALSGEEAGTPELDRLRIETLKEVGSVIMNGIMVAVGNTLQSNLEYTVPTYEKGSIASLMNHGDYVSDFFVKMTTICVELGDLKIEGRICMVLEESQVRILLDKIKEILS